ncbi:NADH dehydrogenase ubiquinone 1 alpha subcomplex subunit 9 [Asticcacaulis biprosthecium C19]|uniref:NADH dehydrogenase ubiquinone 1 alpha subcomplex subunit 9 n=1 Tax=Asticcacaulis biprosthecium C19 TaxID=715226 RepID=F4QL12_9CAUL|nr:complex I NDUFA9 subunit family protein [Asticcacaulis biprosthecium]EGF92235.1 NADH dehydrogenase ubiquinone 1 alpha subcomplex subunit 9 [Asticcacaulis biprosthecium C19]
MTRVVTVFGGSGFLGKQVVRLLARSNWRVRVAVRHLAMAYDVKPMGDVGQIQVVRCDVRRDSEIEAALKGADACVNLVGLLYETLSAKFDAVHRHAATKMAQICAAKGIKDFVQVSALGADPKSSSAYASSKGWAEDGVRKAIPTAVIIRPSIIFGQGDGFFTMLAAQLKLFPVIPAFGGAENKFQPVYVGDVAGAVAKTLGNASAYGKVYELGGPEVFAFKDLIAYVGKEIQQPRPLVWAPFFVARMIGLAGDVQAGVHGMLSVVPAPLLTTDQVLLLQKDNVVPKGALGLKDLGIAATAVESIAPTYLWRFRKNGQFAIAA